MVQKIVFSKNRKQKRIFARFHDVYRKGERFYLKKSNRISTHWFENRKKYRENRNEFNILLKNLEKIIGNSFSKKISRFQITGLKNVVLHAPRLNFNNPYTTVDPKIN